MNPALFSARDFSSHHIHPLDDVWHVCCHRTAGQWTCRHRALTCTEDVRTCVSRARVDVRLKLHPVAMSGKQLSCSSNRHPQPTTPQRIIRWHILAVQNFILIFYRVERKKNSPPFPLARARSYTVLYSSRSPLSLTHHQKEKENKCRQQHNWKS